MQERPADPAFIRTVIQEIVDALHTLHENSILHLDLKPTNILIRSKEPLDLVLSDFGISTLFNPEISRKITQVKGTPQYWAPEQMTGVVGKEVDYWALGMIVLELLLGKHPFANTEKPVVMYTLTTKRVEIPITLPGEFIPFLKGCLTRDPKRRWGYGEVTRWLRGDTAVPIYYDAEQVTTTSTAMPAAAVPYRFQGIQYHDFSSLLNAICESEENWAEGIKHLGRGFIYKWLEENKLYDEAVKVNEYIESNKDLDCTLSLLVARYAPDMPFMLSGREISVDTLGSSLGHDLQGSILYPEKKIVDYLFDGTLQNLFEKFITTRDVSIPTVPTIEPDSLDSWCLKYLLNVPHKIESSSDLLVKKTFLFQLASYFSSIRPLFYTTPFSPAAVEKMVEVYTQYIRVFEKYTQDLPEFPLLYLDRFKKEVTTIWNA